MLWTDHDAGCRTNQKNVPLRQFSCYLETKTRQVSIPKTRKRGYHGKLARDLTQGFEVAQVVAFELEDGLVGSEREGCLGRCRASGRGRVGECRPA